MINTHFKSSTNKHKQRDWAATDGNQLNLDGNVTFGDDVTGAGLALGLGHTRIDTGAITITGTDATSISNDGVIVTGRAGAVTFTDMDTNWNAGDPPVLARRWTDGTGNGVRVQTAAPHWMIGVR